MRLLEDAEEFVTTRQLRATFNSSALARPIDVIADALRRNVTCRCSIGAPQDRRRYQSRISWLLEQLPESNLGDTMVHIAWDNGQRTCVALRRLRKDENEGRLDGALPIAFELSRSFDLAQRFAGPKLFVEGVDTAVLSFCDSIARHLRDWLPRPVRGEQEPETAQEAVPDRVVIREANIPGGKVRVFDDGSIEHQTAAGTNWFRSFAELERALRSKDSVKPPQEVPDSNGRGHDLSSPATADVPPAETEPAHDPSRF
jgi:hypothetical protein